MSSIAYITDHEMIEFHRLHGNTNIVFWRPSGQKKFQHFYIGDYLFFLTKGTEKGKKREKGIIGYGRYAKEDIQSVKQIWKKYGSQCGYSTQKLFQSAILKVSKTHELPKRMHCLLLERVMFFQAPVYLSELDKIISKQIESYIYLDQEDINTGWNILNKAMAIGLDMWSTHVEQQRIYIQQDIAILLIQNLHQQCQCDLYTAYEIKKITSFVNAILKQQPGTYLAGFQDDYVLFEQGQPCYCIPCLLSLKHWKRNLMYAVAKAKLYQEKCKEKHSAAKVIIVFDDELAEANAICELASVQYRIINCETYKQKPN